MAVFLGGWRPIFCEFHHFWKMRLFRLILPLAAAYGLLVAGSTTALYYLELEDLEQEMAGVTTKALAQKLSAYPDFELEVTFDRLDAQVRGVAPSAAALSAGQMALAELAREGVEGLPGAIGSLAPDLKRQASFRLYEVEGEGEERGGIYLTAFLPQTALSGIEEGVRRARPAFSGPLGDEEGNEAIAEPDAAVAPWQNRLEDFVSFFFRDGRAKGAEFSVAEGPVLGLAGRVQSEDERGAIVRYAKACFPGLAAGLDYQIEVAPEKADEAETAPETANEIDMAPPMGNRIAVAREAHPIQIEMGQDGEVAVMGMVPTMEAEDRLFELVRSQGTPNQSFVNGLQVVEGVSDIGWLDSRPSFFKDFLASVEGLALIIGPKVVMVEGKVADRATADALMKSLKSQLRDHEVAKAGLTFPGTGAATSAED